VKCHTSHVAVDGSPGSGSEVGVVYTVKGE